MVKLQRFHCVRHGDGQEAAAEESLKAAALQHFGADVWPRVERFYTVEHFEQGARKASALISASECVLLGTVTL